LIDDISEHLPPFSRIVLSGKSYTTRLLNQVQP
jgi:hypothetical protein